MRGWTTVLLSIVACSASNESSLSNSSSQSNDSTATIPNGEGGSESSASESVSTSDSTTSSSTTALAPTKIYATFVSHNEEDSNVVCAELYKSQSTFLNNRDRTLAMANAIVEGGATWDLQSDWQYIEEMKKYEDAIARNDTGGLYSLQYIAQLSSSQIAMDAHSHETVQYNYADIVYMLSTLGLSTTSVVGGFIFDPPEEENWTRFWKPLQGNEYDFSWQAEILWGAATFGHQDEDCQASGVWRPKGADAFLEDDPSKNLVFVGQYLNNLDSTGSYIGVDDLLSKLKNGELEDNRMYTAAIMFNQCDVTEEMIAEAQDRIASYQEEVDNGNLVWATLSQTVQSWETDYASVPVIYEPN